MTNSSESLETEKSSDYIKKAKAKLQYLKRQGQIGETKAEKQKVYLQFLVSDILSNKNFTIIEKQLTKKILLDYDQYIAPERIANLFKKIVNHYKIPDILSFIEKDAGTDLTPKQQPE